MAPRGMKPKPEGESRFRGTRMHDWVEVDRTPFNGGPDLPARRRSGERWPDRIRTKWDAWRSMPHARLWREPDWEYALDTVELAATAFQADAKVGLLAEQGFREKQMGTTWSARQDMHIRYVDPVDREFEQADAVRQEAQNSLIQSCDAVIAASSKCEFVAPEVIAQSVESFTERARRLKSTLTYTFWQQLENTQRIFDLEEFPALRTAITTGVRNWLHAPSD